MGNNEVPSKQEEGIGLSTVERLTWMVLIGILIAQYGLGVMAEPVPEKFIYALGTAALGLNQMKRK